MATRPPDSVRPAGEAEAAAVAGLLSRAGFGPTVGRLVAFPRASPHGDVLVAPDDGGGLIGAACCASFGETGWIGALGVAPEARRRGVGTALTLAAVERLRERGAGTILLFATDAGRPVYERLGFVPEGVVTSWRGSHATARAGLTLRRLHDGDRAAMAVLDARATGERRDAVLGAIAPLSGLAAERASVLAGWAAGSPWGAGVAVCAADPEAGVALMAAATTGAQSTAIVVPDANAAAIEALRRWRFAEVNASLRMRLGPPVAWCPERQFGLFNLFWG